MTQWQCLHVKPTNVVIASTSMYPGELNKENKDFGVVSFNLVGM